MWAAIVLLDVSSYSLHKDSSCECNSQRTDRGRMEQMRERMGPRRDQKRAKMEQVKKKRATRAKAPQA